MPSRIALYRWRVFTVIMKFLPATNGRTILLALGAAAGVSAFFFWPGAHFRSQVQQEAGCSEYGTITEYPLSSPNTAPVGIKAGTDGSLWFTQAKSTNVIGRISTDGVILGEYEPPDLQPPDPRRTADDKAGYWPWVTMGTAVDRDGNYWFMGGKGVYSVTPAGKPGNATTALRPD